MEACSCSLRRLHNTCSNIFSHTLFVNYKHYGGFWHHMNILVSQYSAQGKRAVILTSATSLMIPRATEFSLESAVAYLNIRGKT